MREELQELALDIFQFASSRNIRLDLTWIPRHQNSEADPFSKVVDIDDYSVHDDVFIHLDRLWGPHSIDIFASSYNAKLPRLNSRFLQSGTEAVDAFFQDWSCDNNWIVPPITVVGKVLSHMCECKAVGTLIVPMWKSSYFWPLLCNDGMHLNSSIKHWLCLPSRPDLFVAGRAKNKLFGTKAFKSPCLALGVDFLQPERLFLLGFVPHPSAIARFASRSGFSRYAFSSQAGVLQFTNPLILEGFILHCPVDWVELFDFQSFIMFPPPTRSGGLRDVLYVPPVVRAC